MNNYRKVLWLLGLIIIGAVTLSSCEDDFEEGNNPPPSPEEQEMFEMVFVEGGSFIMGSNDYYTEFMPAAETILPDFYIGKYEVTQKEWEEVMGSNPNGKGDNKPVNEISWHEAVAFCNALSCQEGLEECYEYDSTGNVEFHVDRNGYRLPTEAEWEYAANGGQESEGYKYSGSDNFDDVAWNLEEGTHDVGLKQPNELGIYDMTGNVSELCSDIYELRAILFSWYYHAPVNDPIVDFLDNGHYRVLKSVSFSEASFFNITRWYFPHTDKREDVGFRIARRP